MARSFKEIYAEALEKKRCFACRYIKRIGTKQNPFKLGCGVSDAKVCSREGTRRSFEPQPDIRMMHDEVLRGWDRITGGCGSCKHCDTLEDRLAGYDLYEGDFGWMPCETGGFCPLIIAAIVDGEVCDV